MSKLRYWIWLSTLSGLSPLRQVELLKRFQTPEQVFLADAEVLKTVEGITKKELEAIGRRDFRVADSVLEDCEKQDIRILTIDDAAYPRRLRDIPDPPLVLYYRGNFPNFDSLPVVAVVGTRKASAYGLTTARRMGYQLARCGGVVVSGAAKGIDSQALEGALSAGGQVAAVLGNGLDIVYPAEARRLYADILAHGCLISEYPPGTRPLGWHFPQRNRLMSGLSVAVLVVEAPAKSGSLITANLALEQARGVYAVPGNLGLASCEGSNQLIQEGAGFVTCGWDLLQNYQAAFPALRRREDGDGPALRQQTAPRNLKVAAPVQVPAKAEKGNEPSNPEKRIDNTQKRNYSVQKLIDSLGGDERTLAEQLREGPVGVDDLIDRTGLGASTVLSTLTLMEVKGTVRRQSGMFSLNLE